MFFSILHRKIFLELMKVFLIALVSITGMILLAGVVGEATRNGLSPIQILAVIPLLIPSTLPYTLPTTTLFATCVIYGRLAHDNEILAIKAAGVNILSAIWPAVFLGLALSVVIIGMYIRLIPWAEHQLLTYVLNDPEEFMYSVLRRDGRLSMPGVNYEVLVGRIQGRKLINADFLCRNPNDKNLDIVARAKEAEIQVDVPNKKILIKMRHCWIDSKSGEKAYVQDKVWPVEMPEEWSKPPISRVRAMSWAQLREQQKNLLESKQKVELEINSHLAAMSLGNAPDHFKTHVHHLQNMVKHIEHNLHELEGEAHKRPALALGCLCFVLVGCPVGIWFSRADFLSAFIACFLPIVLLYYPLMLCGINMGSSGRLPPYVMAGPDLLMILISFGLYRRLLQH